MLNIQPPHILSTTISSIMHIFLMLSTLKVDQPQKLRILSCSYVYLPHTLCTSISCIIGYIYLIRNANLTHMLCKST